MAEELGTYSFKDVLVLVGLVAIQGFAEGTSIKFELPEEWATTKGAGGAVARSRVCDNTVKATLTLLQTSPSNAYLTGLARADRATNRAIDGFLAKDLNGFEVVASRKCYIEKVPDIEYGDAVGTRTWVIMLTSATGLALGSPAT